MASTRTRKLSAIRARIRELGEHRSSYISDAALDREINQAYYELYEKLVSAGSDDYFEKTHEFDIVSGTASYALPADYFKTIGVDIKLTNNNYVNIGRYNKAQRNKYSIYRIGAVSREWAEYRIRGNNIVLVPEPNWSQAGGLRHLYVPLPTELSADDDTLDGVCGWEDWVVYKCLILFAGKEETDPGLWMQLLGGMEQRIEDMLVRDRAESEAIRDLDEEETERVWPRYGTPP